MKLVAIKVGDWAYRRELAPSTIKGPWEADPFKIVKVYQNQITGDRDGQISWRDRKDWKLVDTRPAHLTHSHTTARHEPD